MKRYIVIAVVAALVFALVIPTACAKKPAEFAVTDLVITPTEAEVWEEVTVATKVENIGDLEGTYTLILKIDGIQIETKDITVAGGDEKTVNFTFSRDIGPSCDVEVNGIIQTVAVREGVLTSLSVGDRWVSRAIDDGVEYTLTLEVTGEDVIEGKSCYVTEGSIEPPLEGVMDSVSIKLDKATMFVAKMQMSGEYLDVPFIVVSSYSYEVDGELYPLEVGEEIRVVETETTTTKIMGETETETVRSTYTFKVEKIEEITVPAGTFRCFKIVKYDEAGTAVSTDWDSDKVKQYTVKSIDLETDEVTEELISYSIQ